MDVDGVEAGGMSVHPSRAKQIADYLFAGSAISREEAMEMRNRLTDRWLPPWDLGEPGWYWAIPSASEKRLDPELVRFTSEAEGCVRTSDGGTAPTWAFDWFVGPLTPPTT